MGLIMAGALPAATYFQAGHTSAKILILAALTGFAGYLANKLRGQWITIVGLVGTNIMTFLAALSNGGEITWGQMILQLVIQVSLAVQPPAKSVGYEQTPVIEGAKAQGEQIVAAQEAGTGVDPTKLPMP